jgi:hypothetical protein
MIFNGLAVRQDEIEPAGAGPDEDRSFRERRRKIDHAGAQLLRHGARHTLRCRNVRAAAFHSAEDLEGSGRECLRPCAGRSKHKDGERQRRPQDVCHRGRT